ncbi:MAG: DUF2934 domain-containing protein [Candidatus Acidiferrales bacterium]
MSHTTGVKTAFEVNLPKQTLHAQPTAEQIRQRAYEIYLSRGGAPGDEVQDWLQAESELGAEQS